MLFNRRFFEGTGQARLFDKGALKYVILDLVKDNPRHGYEIMRALEARCLGLYSPSPGSIYPTLQMLEDMGYVTQAESEGKKVYTITEAGRQYLKEKEGVMEKIRRGMKDRWAAGEAGEWRRIAPELHRLGHLLVHNWHRLTPEQLVRIREAITQACQDIEAIVGS